MKDVTTRLLAAKDALGYSYSDIAKITGLPKSSIQRFLTGTTEKFPLEFLEPICKALQVSAADVMGWDETDDVMEIREALRRDPNMRILFSAAAKVSPEHIKTAAALLKALEPEEFSE